MRRVGFGTGESHYNVKLSEEDVREIRKLGIHYTYKEIYEMPKWKNKISRSAINDILVGRTWKNLK